MKALIIYYSNYKNNTEKVARIFEKRLNSHTINIRNIKEVPNVENYNLIGFGSGVYGENISSKILKLADSLDIKGKNVFVFSTSGVGMKFYNNSLIKLLELKGGINIGSFACKGSFIAEEFTDKKIFNIMGRLSQGHPNYKDLKRAEKFVDKIIIKI